MAPPGHRTGKYFTRSALPCMVPMSERHVQSYWAPFLHLYQPPTQDHHVLKEINDTCYEPLLNMLLEHPEFKVTFNVNAVLFDLLEDHGLSHTTGLVRELVGRRQVDIVGTGKYHPILPLVPRKEVINQVTMQETDLATLFPGWERRGFFAPEMAVSPGIASLLARSGYRWLLSSGIACASEWPYDRIYQSPEGLLLFFRDDVISNEISFQKTSVEFFLDKLRVLYKTKHYIITAQDGETFGHHVPHYEKTFLEKAMTGAVEDPDIEICWISDLPALFPVTTSIRLIPSSWSTSQADLDYNAPYPLWNHPDNPVHRIQYKFLKNVLELVYLLEDNVTNGKVQEARTARFFLDKGLHSCPFWWASMRPMWSPNMIMKGAELLLRAAFNARIGLIDAVTSNGTVSHSEQLFDQVSQYYSMLLMEITRMEQVICGKRLAQDTFFEDLFTSDGNTP